ncbi:MAG: ABC transporter transmembrane domain-containing protein [Candidatus Latescibacterota bacterium]
MGEIRSLLHFVRPYGRRSALALALLAAVVGLDLAIPRLIQHLIDEGIAHHDLQVVLGTTALMLGISLLEALLAFLLLGICALDCGCEALSSWIMARLSQDALRRVRQELFAHLQRLAVGFFDVHPAGELMSRLTNDIQAVNQAVSQNVVSLVASSLSMVGILVAMFVLNARLAVAGLVVVPLLLWFARFVARYTPRGSATCSRNWGSSTASWRRPSRASAWSRPSAAARRP